MAKGDRLPRLLKLVSLIQHHPGLSADELARVCNVVPRQIYKDLRILDYAGVPIYNDNGYRMTQNYLLQDISFSLDEALSLLYGLKLIERQKALFPVQRVKDRLLALLPKGLSDGIEDIDSKVDIAEGPAADYSGKADLFRVLNQSMRELKCMEIEYYTFGRDEKTTRSINPYYMIFKDGFWYLVAFCHLRGEQRLFRVDRIKHFRHLNEKFNTPPEDIQKPYWSTAWGMEMGEEFEFKIRFIGESARFVRETQFHPHQKVEVGPDGSVIFTAKAYGLKSVTRWILPFGGEAEVLEPKGLRSMVSIALKSGLSQYEK